MAKAKVKKTEPTSLEGMTTKQIEELLNERKEAERAEREELREEYEKSRNELINDLGEQAVRASEVLKLLKGTSFKELLSFREKLLEYGDLRRGDKNKGSFEIKNDDYKIMFTSHVSKKFDERAELAEEKLKTFLSTFVKKRDKELYEMITGLLERTKGGDFDINLINRLYAMEEKFDDENWRDALRLFKESYSPTGTAQYVRFFKKDANGAWETVLLDFAKVKLL